MKYFEEFLEPYDTKNMSNRASRVSQKTFLAPSAMKEPYESEESSFCLIRTRIRDPKFHEPPLSLTSFLFLCEACEGMKAIRA